MKPLLAVDHDIAEQSPLVRLLVRIVAVWWITYVFLAVFAEFEGEIDVEDTPLTRQRCNGWS